MVTEKRIQRTKRTFFVDNVRNMFVLSILQIVNGTSNHIKSYCRNILKWFAAFERVFHVIFHDMKNCQ